MTKRLDRALGEHRAELEGEVRRPPHLAPRRAEPLWRRLAAILGVRTELRPPRFDELPIGGREALWRYDAGGGPARALPIAALVQRFEHLLRKTRRFAEDRFGGLGRVVRKDGIRAQCAGVQELLQHETKLPDRCAIHQASSGWVCG